MRRADNNDGNDLEMAAPVINHLDPPNLDAAPEQHQLERRSSQLVDSSASDIEEEMNVRSALANLEARTKPFVMSSDTMFRLGFDIKVQVARVIVTAICLFSVQQFEV